MFEKGLPGCRTCGKQLSSQNVTGYCRSCFGKTRRGPNSPSWNGDNVTEYQLHRRIWSTRGKAKEYDCVSCGEPADEWSLTHDADPYDVNNYNPRCFSCHRYYDKPGHGNLGKPWSQARRDIPIRRDDNGRFARLRRLS
jgi:hypothetical protein